MKKTLITLFVLIFLISCFSSTAFAVVGVGDDFYVNDTADVLSDRTKKMIDDFNGDLEYYCSGAQIVVVTVEYLDGMYSDEYAGALFENYGVGSSTYNNGMLLLLATGENKAWLTVGKGICNAFTDDMVDDYFDTYFWEDFDNGDYDTAVYNMVYNLAWWFADYYNVTERAQNASGAQSEDVKLPTGTPGALGKLAGFGILGALLYGIISLLGRILGFVFSNFITILIIVIIIARIIQADRQRWNAYYRFMGVPIPIYRPWYIFSSRPYRSWHDHNDRGPRGPGGFGGGGFWGGSGGGFGGSSGGSFGGHSGGFGGGGHVGGGFGGGGGMGGGGGRR